ncbi:MAG: GNAT family N-acetyltransferase [Bacteroidetes bacterium]|nr:MAG: GNAT family N-acetyltransferase [Bacteroidota bacterium]REK04951.1 MAG: GNAT family N-acetyltransferase [Bacteroidota bacterium]REK50911.1 MAG: GNAT family N-acetyltransferase [Bacteroidota bacterium]
MNVIIRKGKKEDIPQVFALIQELAEFEKAPEQVSNTAEELAKEGFGPNPSYRLLVAEHEEIIVGMAIYFVKYSTWKGRGLFLDDLIVTEKMRSKGIGRMLLNAFLEVAGNEGAKQVHWQVLDWNTPAINFYRNIGSKIDHEWLDCKMSPDEIEAYLKKSASSH